MWAEYEYDAGRDRAAVENVLKDMRSALEGR
jgi:hypothetical protein